MSSSIEKISEDNPFKDDIIRFQNRLKTRTNTITNDSPEYKHTKITVIEQIEYFPGSFSKLYQNRELLEDLSPEACKVLIHIALNLDYNSESMRIRQKDTGLSRRVFPRAMIELLTKRIIAKGRLKREWYWVNITLLIVGTIGKHQD